VSVACGNEKPLSSRRRVVSVDDKEQIDRQFTIFKLKKRIHVPGNILLLLIIPGTRYQVPGIRYQVPGSIIVVF